MATWIPRAALIYCLVMAGVMPSGGQEPAGMPTTSPPVAAAPATEGVTATPERTPLPGDGRPVRREILALYDSRFETQPHLTRIHKFAEMPLNHLGYSVVYWDIDKGLPDTMQLGKSRGVLSWFEQPVAKPVDYLRWAREAADSGLSYVVIGSPGAVIAPENMRDINGLFAAIGLHHTGEFVDATFLSAPIVKDPAMVEFERKLDPVLAGFPLITAERPDLTPHLTIATSKTAQSQSSVLIATSARGGYVHDEFAIVYEPIRDRVSWILNPFVFFKKAFGADRFPIPDVTTVSGRRVYFSQIDGDGWNNVSEVERYKRTGTSSAEVVLKELIEPFPDLPVTVGLIGGDIDSELGGDPAARGIARQIYALPQVEIGSHTYTHPYAWEFFEHYSREEELKLLDKQQSVEGRLYDRAVGALMTLAKKEKPQHKHQRYIAGTDDLPRTYLRRPFELDLEIEGSLRAVEQLGPTDKRAMLLQWSGDTLPFAAAIKASRDAGVRNINGGDSRLDFEYPSTVYVPPISRPVRAERQIYAVNSNENTYTNDWTGPYYGFRKLEETVRNTEKPRRLKGFNLYYHMYSGEKPAALEAVKRHLETARHAAVIPIPASLYAGMADSFFDVELVEIGPNRWSVNNRGEVQTVRFDDAAPLQVDFALSEGVIGASRHEGSLYVALDSDVETPVVALMPLDAMPVQPVPPHLVDSRWRISEFTPMQCGFKAAAEGFGHGQMTWEGLSPGSYLISASKGEQEVWRRAISVHESGRIEVEIEASALAPLVIAVDCVPPS